MNPEEFDQMVRALRDGDAAPAEAFVRLYEPHLRYLIRIRLSHSPLARLFDSVDVCQSILKSFFQLASEGGFRPNSADHLRRYLVRMALNKLATYIRKAGPGANVLPLDPETAAPLQSPLEQLADEDSVQRALSLLSGDQREWVRRRFFEGQDWADIGKDYDLSADAVRMRVDRALDLLRERLPAEE